MYRQYPAMFNWFSRSFSAEPELGASYIYHCLGSGAADNVFWTILEVLYGDDFKIDETCLLQTSNAIIKITKLNKEGKNYE
jgi:hypothetical protein